MLALKSLTFVYLPFVQVPKDIQRAMLSYYFPNNKVDSYDKYDLEHGLKSNFLLDYMVRPQNRHHITSSFAWFNTSRSLLNGKELYIFDYISFDVAEAISNPRGQLEAMLPILGESNLWVSGVCCPVHVDDSESADDNFDAETKKNLLEIQEKLNAVRLKGISESIITQYIKPYPELSRITIHNDFSIILNDYQNTEKTMETVYTKINLI